MTSGITQSVGNSHSIGRPNIHWAGDGGGIEAYPGEGEFEFDITIVCWGGDTFIQNENGLWPEAGEHIFTTEVEDEFFEKNQWNVGKS